MRTRDFRRYQLAKKKRWVEKVIAPKWGIDKEDENYYNSWIGIHARSPKKCSCWMCGNPRKLLKGKKDCLTIQEQKQLIKERTDE